MSVFNGSRHIAAAIESVLAQTYSDFELLVVDDASTDDSAAIMRSYDDRRIRVVQNRSNMGLTHSLNRGIELAEGIYLARLDCDDVCEPKRLEAQVGYLDAHPECAVLATRILMIDKEGATLGEWKHDRQAQTPASIRFNLLHTNCIAHSSVMLRRDVARAYRYAADQRHSQDYDLWLRICSDGLQIHKLAEPLVRWRLHDDNITARGQKRSGFRISGTKLRFLRSQVERRAFGAYELALLAALPFDVLEHPALVAIARQIARPLR
jgi:glycosyltransferase involved in cell wall biosynthesis